MATHAELPEADRAGSIALSLEVASTLAPADVLAALGSRGEGLLWVRPLSTWAWSSSVASVGPRATEVTSRDAGGSGSQVAHPHRQARDAAFQLLELTDVDDDRLVSEVGVELVSHRTVGRHEELRPTEQHDVRA